MKPLVQEVERYEKVYTSIVFGLDEVGPVLSKEEMHNRLCSLYLPKLKKYIDLLKEDAADYKQKGFFTKVAGKEDTYDVQIRDFKKSHGDKLAKLEQCAKCKCLNCVKICAMRGCHNCSPEAHVVSCDNKKKTVYFFTNKVITLKDDESGQNTQFNVIAHIYDKECDLFYIAMEANGDKRINYLDHGTAGDSYRTITDTDDFNFAVVAYQEAFDETD